jgi:site-specific recombinase XerD
VWCRIFRTAGRGVFVAALGFLRRRRPYPIQRRCVGYNVMVDGGLAGSARMELAGNVLHLDPPAAVFEAMLAGWSRQQRARFLRERTIEPRVALVRRMAEFSGLYPWQWTPAEAEEFVCSLRSGVRPVTVSTVRGYECAVRMFVDYVLDARYGWPETCQQRFGMRPQQVFHELNSVVHVTEYEGQPSRRPLTYDEVQALFDAADDRARGARRLRRKGVLAATRDAALLKTVYAFGLRRSEAWGLDLSDTRHNPKVAEFGRFGALLVRYGKASRGSPPKRRTVLLVPEMDWVVPVLQQWVDEVRPLLSPGQHPALWVTERRGRLSRRAINDAFVAARDVAELDKSLDLHCLRHSYVTHLVEFDYPERFVQEQVGHACAASTAIYTGVSDEYRNRLLAKALRQRLPELENLA